jgi:signal transduction histidine kinase
VAKIVADRGDGVSCALFVSSWLSSQWRAFQRSYEKSDVLAGSHPTPAAVGLAGMVTLFSVIGYVPRIAQAAQFSRPWLSIALTLIGGSLTYAVWRTRLEGISGNLATVFDNVCYSAALAHAACSMEGGYAVGLAVTYGFVVIAFPGRSYGLTAIFSVAMAAPLAILFVLHMPSSEVVIILVCSYIMMLVASAWTGRRRELLAAQEKLAQAVGTTSRVADDSFQAAVATTLLSLGHFLHELRNHQTVVRTNLTFIKLNARLDEAGDEALSEALTAQDAEEQLMRETMETLKGRARTSKETFEVQDVLGQAPTVSAAGLAKTTVVLTLPVEPFFVAGSADHLNAAIVNLLRNSEQAGASRVELGARLEPGGHAIKITVHDDGPGIPEEQWEKVFVPFGYTTKAAGTGLGLYLCRRHVELLGGTIELGRGPLGGASFEICLPGDMKPAVIESVAPAAQVSAE